MTSWQRKTLFTFVARNVVPIGGGGFIMGRDTIGKSLLLQTNPETGELLCSCKCFDKIGVCIHATLLETAFKAVAVD